MSGRKDVVTLYFCGSGNHRDQGDKNALPHLHDITKGTRKVIFDGPGGANIVNAEKILKRVEKGKDAPMTANVFQKNSVRKAKGWDKMLKNVHKGVKEHSILGQKNGATGGGTQSNIVVALQWLWMEWHKERFVDINLVGFSRGGVSCIMLAHAIQEAGFNTLGNIRVNIFTFDPVPGGLNDFKNKGKFDETGRVGDPKTLPVCVASYRSILQENVDKWLVKWLVPKDKNFKCVVPDYKGSNPNRTPRDLYSMPGGHGASQSYNSGTGAGAIGLHLCQSFLEDHGTEFSGSGKLSPDKLIEAYATVRVSFTQDDKAFGAKKKASKHRAGLVTNPFRSHPYFVNHHHAGLMYQNYPDIAKTIDGDGELSESRKAALYNVLPQTFSNLANFGFLN